MVIGGGGVSTTQNFSFPNFSRVLSPGPSHHYLKVMNIVNFMFKTARDNFVSGEQMLCSNKWAWGRTTTTPPVKHCFPPPHPEATQGLQKVPPKGCVEGRGKPPRPAGTSRNVFCKHEDSCGILHVCPMHAYRKRSSFFIWNWCITPYEKFDKQDYFCYCIEVCLYRSTLGFK